MKDLVSERLLSVTVFAWHRCLGPFIPNRQTYIFAGKCWVFFRERVDGSPLLGRIVPKGMNSLAFLDYSDHELSQIYMPQGKSKVTYLSQNLSGRETQKLLVKKSLA